MDLNEVIARDGHPDAYADMLLLVREDPGLVENQRAQPQQKCQCCFLHEYFL